MTPHVQDRHVRQRQHTEHEPRQPSTSFSFGNFDCRYYDSSGTLVGRLAWTSGTPGTLIIFGTVFIDGNLISRAGLRRLPGPGNLYVDGTVTFSGQAKICATPISGSPCLGNYDPNTNLLELVAVNAGHAATPSRSPASRPSRASPS